MEGSWRVYEGLSDAQCFFRGIVEVVGCLVLSNEWGNGSL